MENQYITDAKDRMDKTISAFSHEIAKVRTGKATTGLLDGVKVEYYGNLSPISQVANVTVLDAHTLSITPWEKSMVVEIDRAIMKADLGLNPVNDGTNIKVPIPMLTEERRNDLVKLVKKYGEDAKIAIRNVRRDANDHLKRQEKAKELTEDFRHDAETEVQKLTDKHITKIDEMLKLKEIEILKV